MSESREKHDRLEPDILPIYASIFYASAAISLKRIADALEAREKRQSAGIVDDGFQPRGIRSCG